MQRWLGHFDTGWLIAALLPLLVILALPDGDQIARTADGPMHVHRIHAMTTLMQQGDFYPRWIPWFHFGYGYPIFNFYAPLGTWLGGLLGLLGIHAAAAFNLLTAISWVVGSLGMYGLARRFLPASGALVAAALWVYAPARLYEVWMQGSISHILATALVPWVFWALVNVIENPGRRACAGLALAFGALLLAHQPTMFITGLFVSIVAVGLSLREAQKANNSPIPRLLWVAGGLALGLVIAAIFLLPLALELNLIVINTPADDVPATLGRNFLKPSDLFLLPLLVDMSDLSRSIPHTFGLVAAILGAAGLGALVWRRRFALATLLLVAMLVAIFLLLEVSLPVWLRVPLMDQLRYPWRILRVAVVFVALLGGTSVLLFPRWQHMMSAGALILVIGAGLPYVTPHVEKVDFTTLSPADAIRFEQTTGAVGVTSFDEFKPVWGANNPRDLPPSVDDYASAPMRLYPIIPIDGVALEQIDDQTVRVQAVEPFTLSFRQFYFPGWTATIDGDPIVIAPEPDFGLISMEIPAGEHVVRLHWSGTLVENLAPLVTLAGLGIAIWFYLTGKPSAVPSEQKLSPRFALWFGGGLLAFGLISTIVGWTQNGWLPFASSLDTPRGMEHFIGARFGDSYELLGYTLHTQEADPGGEVEVTLYWHPLRPLERTHRPRVQIVNRSGTAAWGVSERDFVGYNALPHTPQQFISETHTLRLFDDAPPYVGLLRVALVASDGTLERLADGSEFITLSTPVRIRGSQLEARHTLDYTIAERLTLTCASITRTDGVLRVSLYWRINAPFDRDDLTVFVHGLDAAGNAVSQGDAPPFGGNYLPSEWLPGQSLIDQYTLYDASEITQVAIGIYTPEERLPIIQGETPVPDNRILLPVEQAPCQN